MSPPLIASPASFSADGLWLEDPHGMRIHLVEQPREIALAAGEPFRINQPGQLDRLNRAGVKAVSQSAPGMPLRLGHLLVFTPDTMKSVAFVAEALGMALADHAQDVIAFCCARGGSDHHVLAFAQSPSVQLAGRLWTQERLSLPRALTSSRPVIAAQVP